MKKSPSPNDQHKPQLTTKAYIAGTMNITVDTLRRRLRKVGMVVPRGAIFPKQLTEIYEKLGWPND